MYVFAAIHVYECARVCMHLHKGQRSPLVSVLLHCPPEICRVGESGKAGRTRDLRVCPSASDYRGAPPCLALGVGSRDRSLGLFLTGNHFTS